MPSTLKDGSPFPTPAKDAERSPEIGSSSGETGGAQPVALEVPVTVNGARAVEGSEKREPFSETTSTVLVLANGAVIRLSSSVAPGQLLFLTNEKTKKEIVCQVVKSKNYRSVSGYVELEFTQPVLGFWGMRFPGERSAPLPAAQKIDAGTAGIPVKSVEAKPVSFTNTRPPAQDLNTNLADAVQEFKTEIKADSRPSSKADFLAPSAEPSIDGLKLEANRLQEQLSALLFAEEKQSTAKPADPVVPSSKRELGNDAAKIFEMAEEPAPAVVKATPVKSEPNASVPAAVKSTPAKSSFEDEEVKIPAWLEPLARNAAVPAPPAEESGSDSSTQAAEPRIPDVAEPAPAAKQTKPAPKVNAKSPGSTPKPAPAVAVFGNTLLGQSGAAAVRPRGSGKGIWMAIAAGLIVAAAGGGWYFRESLASLVGGHTQAETSTSLGSTAPAAVPAAPAMHSAAVATSPPTPTGTPDTASSVSETKVNSAHTAPDAPAPTSDSTSSPASGKVQTASISERIAKSNFSGDVIKEPAKSIEVVEPEIKKTLGKVRLAKPKVGHSGNVQAGEMEPSLEASTDALSVGGNSFGGNLVESSKQPAAPAAAVAVGGDVKPARLISSVPPVYPALARTQRVGGDVRIDALIDATGRVTTMKVMSGPSLLHQPAMDALRQWKYHPAMLDGKPVPMHLTVTIQFRLQ